MAEHPVCASVSGGILCLKHLEDLYSRPLESNPETAIFLGGSREVVCRSSFLKLLLAQSPIDDDHLITVVQV